MENMKACTPAKISACALAFAFAVTCALAFGVIGMVAWHFKIGGAWASVVSSIYVGFALTPKGIAIGMLWGFLEGYILGLLIGCFYNIWLKICKCKACHPKEG